MDDADRVSKAQSWSQQAFERGAVASGTRPKISAQRNASQLARAPRPVRGKSLVGMRIKLAGEGVSLNRGIKLVRVKLFKPGAKPCKLARRKLFDGFLDVFGGRHGKHIALSR